MAPRIPIDSDQFQQISGDITQYLRKWSKGDLAAFDKLIIQVYDELHRAASYWLRANLANHTLPPTALVSELYLRFTGLKSADFHSRGQFFKFAGVLIRQILVDSIRHRKSIKRGGDQVHIPLEHFHQSSSLTLSPDKILAIHNALNDFETVEPRKAKVIELRFFCGFTIPEIAQALEISKITVSRDLAIAKVWLARTIETDIPCDNAPHT